MPRIEEYLENAPAAQEALARYVENALRAASHVTVYRQYLRQAFPCVSSKTFEPAADLNAARAWAAAKGWDLDHEPGEDFTDGPLRFTQRA